MKNIKYTIILFFLSVSSFAQTSTGWQTIYESNIGKIDMMVTINDPNAKKHMHHSGVYFRTNIPYSVHINVYCKEITCGYDNGKPRYNEQLQSTFFNKANNWRNSDVLTSDVRSFKNTYIHYLEIENQILFKNGQEISQFYYSPNNSSSTNQNGNNTSNNNYKNFSDLVAEHNKVCQELMTVANNTGNNSNMLTSYCQQGGNVIDSPNNRIRLKNEINEMNNEILILKNNNKSNKSGTSSMNRGGNVVSGNSTNTNSEGTGWNGNNGDSNISTQRQQELNKKQYNNTINQGVTNLQNGNYTDAIQNYSNALNTATTKSEKNIATTGIVVSSIGGVFDAIAKEKEEQRIKEEQLRLIKQKNEAIAKEELTRNWKIANENADLKNTEGYKKAIEIMLPYANANKINGMALNKIGDWYNNLNDFNNAIKWYEKAVLEDNNSCALHNLGSIYEKGKGVVINFEKALELYQKSCKKEDETGCKMYEKLKSKIDSEVEVAKKKISSFNLKNCVDYLVLQCEKSGFKYDNITKYCINDLSKKISVSFNKNNKILAFNFVVEYNNTMSKIDRVLNYTVDSDLLIDFSKLQLSSLIGNEKISEKYVSGFFELLQSTPKQGNLNGIKSTKYKGFEKETTIKNDNNLEAFLHNAAISCNSDEANSWLAKAGDAGNFECYKTIFYNQLNNKNTNHSYASKYILKYIEAIEIKLKSENNVKTELIKELDNLAYDIFEANKNYEIEERKYNKYNYYLEKYSICIKKIADLDGHKAIKYTGLIYEKGMGLNKNYEQAVYYYSKLTNDPEAMCKIANLYKTGGDKNFNVFKKNKKLAKEWKLKSKNAGGVCN